MITRRARAGRVTLLASVPLLALVTLAAGCGTVTTPPSAGSAGGTGSTHPSASGSPSSPTSSTTAAPVPTTTGGPPIRAGVPSCSGWPANAAHETMPPSFVPVAVLRCVSAEQTIPGRGQWLTETLERADSGLGQLISALRMPSAGRAPGTMCPDIAMLPPQIALIGGDGTKIIPRLPLSGCGLVRTQVLGALAVLSWKPVSVRLVSQVQPPSEAASGCTANFKDPFALSGTLRPSAGGEVYPTRPESLRICVYSANGANGFLRGTTVTGKTENVVLSGLSGARNSATCTASHSTFAVVQGGGAAMVYVELGGCDRVFRYQTGSTGTAGLSAGQATTQAVSIIEQVTHPAKP